MEWQEALPLLQENHTGVAISVTPKGRAQSTVVSTAVLDGKVGFASRRRTVKLKNIQRTGRATVTVIKLDTRRYVTVEGPASIEPWPARQRSRTHRSMPRQSTTPTTRSVPRPCGAPANQTRQCW